MQELAKYDVVLTTLGTMAAEWVPCDDAVSLSSSWLAMKADESM